MTVTTYDANYRDAFLRPAKGASRVTLLSNTILAPALKLYAKHGLRTTRLGQHPDYVRANIEMHLDL